MEARTDVLIIGGGVIGVCAALELTRAGRSVTLFERGELCSGASLGNACWVAAGYALPTAAPGVLHQGLRWLLDRSSPFSIRPRASLDLVRWLWRFRAAANREQMLRGAETLLALNRRGLELFRAFDADEDLDFFFREQGLLHLHLSDEARAAGEREAELLRTLGVPCTALDRDGLLALEPGLLPNVVSGVFFPEHAHLDPHQFVHAVADRARIEGATIRTGTAVTGATLDDGRVGAVTTSAGIVHPTEVVLAAGAWSAPLAKLFGAPILMEPAKGYSVTVAKRSDGHGPTRPLAVDDTKVAVTPLDGDRFRSSSTLELAGFDPSVNAHRLAVNQRSLRRILPDMDDLDEDAPWSGYRPMTPDGLPFIGRSERVPNLVFATGHGMMGVTHGPVTAQLVTEIICGSEPSIDLGPLRPERF